MTLEQALAEEICAAFWETAERPMTWATSSPQQKQVWLNCAQRAVARAHRFREETRKAK